MDHDHDLELRNMSSTSNWTNFPINPDTTQVINRTTESSTLEVILDDLVIVCDLDAKDSFLSTESDTVPCPLNQTRVTE